MFSLRTLNLILKEKRPVVFFLSGLPGCGKSTISKSIQDSISNVEIVSKDQIRKELWEASSPDAGKIEWKKNCDSIKDRPSERLVCEERDKRIINAIASGRHIVVDDTNLNPAHLDQIRKIVDNKAIIETMFIDVPVQECVKRDSERPEDQRVGPMIIYSMYNRYLKGRSQNDADGRIRSNDEKHDAERECRVRSDSAANCGSEEGVGRMPENASGRRINDKRSKSKKGPFLDKDSEASGTKRKGSPESGGRSTLGQQGCSERVTPSVSATTGGRELVNKISFATAADKLLEWRKKIVGKENSHGLIKNSRGIWELSWDAPCYDLNGRFIGMLRMSYADQNPKGRSREAKMVSTGRWKQTDAGWLWTTFRGRRVWLAKATPEGSSSVMSGSIVLGKDGKRHFFMNL